MRRPVTITVAAALTSLFALIFWQVADAVGVYMIGDALLAALAIYMVYGLALFR